MMFPLLERLEASRRLIVDHGTQEWAKTCSSKARPRKLFLEESMNAAGSKSVSHPSDPIAPESAVRTVPTFVATDLLEKLIDDRDAQAVHRVVTEGRRQ
jgi:hypothetical protein